MAFSQRLKRKEAADLSHKALAIRQKLLGADNPLVTIASLKLQATELDILGKSSEREATLYKLVAEQRKVLGNEHPQPGAISQYAGLRSRFIMRANWQNQNLSNVRHWPCSTNFWAKETRK